MKPDLDDYFALFRLYGGDLGQAYLEPDDDRYRLLFEQVCHLLLVPSAVNLRLPEPFRTTAQRYLAGDAQVVAHMRHPANQHFMLSDLADYLHYLRRQAALATVG